MERHKKIKRHEEFRSAKSKAYLQRGVGILGSSGHNKLER